MKTILKTLTFPLALAACGGGGGDGGSAATGTLHVQMTDSPSCGFDHVYVTVSKVRVNTTRRPVTPTAAGLTWPCRARRRSICCR